LVDYTHETQSSIISTNVSIAQLGIGDIICSDRVGIERKSVDDFVDTIINPEREMVRQIIDLKRAFDRPLVFLEGETVFGLRGISNEALRSQMSVIALDFGVPIIPTRTIEETAAYIVTIARREQINEKRKISIPHAKRTTMTMPERQAYVVSSIGAKVGASMAERLLKRFGSVRAVMNASIDDLIEVEGIGKKTAENIHEIVRSEYKK